MQYDLERQASSISIGLQGEQSLRRDRASLRPRGDGLSPDEGPRRRRASGAGHQGPRRRRQGILHHGAGVADRLPPQYGR